MNFGGHHLCKSRRRCQSHDVPFHYLRASTAMRRSISLPQLTGGELSLDEGRQSLVQPPGVAPQAFVSALKLMISLFAVHWPGVGFR
jgi:hypothetical protein